MTTEQLPLFPLHTVLFPHGVLPLRIFEPRYLDMIGRVERDGGSFGVVCLTDGDEVQRPAELGAGDAVGESTTFADERFADIGTLARITFLARPQPGLLGVRSEGTQRFRLRRHERLKTGLWMGEAELLAPDMPLAVPQDLLAVRDRLREVIQSIEEQLPNPLHRPFGVQPQWDDCAWVANTWCSLLPTDTRWKQRLLETDSPLLRLELVADLVDRLPRAA